MKISKKNLKLNRPRNEKVETFKKVSMNIERRKKPKLMQKKTPLPELIKKRQKKTVLITVHTVVNRYKIAIITHTPASNLIVSLNTKKEKILVSNAK